MLLGMTGLVHLHEGKLFKMFCFSVTVTVYTWIPEPEYLNIPEPTYKPSHGVVQELLSNLTVYQCLHQIQYIKSNTYICAYQTIVRFFKPGISFKALKYKGQVLCYTERLRLDFVAVSKSYETFFVLEITCLRYSRNVHLVCFKRNARLKKSDYSHDTERACLPGEQLGFI